LSALEAVGTLDALASALTNINIAPGLDRQPVDVASSPRRRQTSGEISACVVAERSALLGSFLALFTGERFMTKLFLVARSFLRRKEEGATMVEYGLMLALIATVCITAVALIGTNASGMFNTIAGKIAGT
jgi:pilus assembly protein Flp/PilA